MRILNLIYDLNQPGKRWDFPEKPRPPGNARKPLLKHQKFTLNVNATSSLIFRVISLTAAQFFEKVDIFNI